MPGDPENSPTDLDLASIELGSQTSGGPDPRGGTQANRWDNDDAAESSSLLQNSFVKGAQYRLHTVVNYFRRHPVQGIVLLFATLAAIVGIDVYLFYRNIKAPVIKTVNINLDPAQSDAQVQVSASMKMHSTTTSFAVNHGQCSYAYRKNDASAFHSGGDMLFSFPKNRNGDTKLDVVVDLHKSDYPVLRRIEWDIASLADAESSVHMSCSVSLTATVYGMLPVSHTFAFDTTVALRDFQLANLAKNSKDNDKDKQLMPKVSIETESLTTSKWQMELLVKVPKKLKKRLTAGNGGHKIESFVVQLPKISYVTNTVDRSRSGERAYLKVRTKATSIDLMAHHKPIKIDLKIYCTTKSHHDTTGNSEEDDQCSMLSALNVGALHSELTQHSFLNVTSHSTSNNFISSFLGHQHHLRTVDNDKFPGNREGEHAHRMLDGIATASLVPLTAADPSISQGAKCVTVDADGVYLSQTCATIQKGFFELYADIYSTDNHAGYLQTSTSWSTSGPLAWSSQLDGSVVSSGTTNKFFGRSTFSETWQNLSLALGFNQSAPSHSEKTLFLEALSAEWDFPNGGANGLLDVQSLTVISGVSPYRVNGVLEYGDDAYEASVKVSNNRYTNNGELFTIAGEGNYGGDWNKWHFGLDESVLIYENSTIGHATGELAYDVPSNPIEGLLGLKFDVTDGKYAPVTASNYTVLLWYPGGSYHGDDDTPTWDDDGHRSWNGAGNVVLLSLYDLYGDGPDKPTLTWNATGVFEYDTGNFTLYAVENPWTPTSTGGVAVAHSTAVLPSPDFEFNAHKQQLLQLPRLKNVAVPRSRDHDRATTETEESVGAYHYPDQFMLFGSGVYDCGRQTGSVTLQNSAVVVDSSIVGSATGEVTYDVSGSSGANGVVTFVADVRDSNFQLWEETRDKLTWSTESAWTSAGDISVISLLTGQSANWNASLNFGYGDNEYNVLVSEQPYGATSDDDSSPYLLYVSGLGGYGGSNAQNWWLTLDDSELIYNTGLVGFATGGLKLSVPPSSGVNGVLSGYSTIENSNHVAQVQGQQQLSWATEDVWTSSGDIRALSQFYIVNGINWNASGVFEYGENSYHVSAVENDYGVNNQEFLVYGMGGYGGDWANWWASLDASELLVTASVVGHATGRIAYESVASDTNATFSFATDVTDGSDALALKTLQILEWNSPSAWVDAGNIEVGSWLDIPEVIWYNATGNFKYNDGAYWLAVNEFDSVGGEMAVPQDHVQLFANGLYGTEINDEWYMILLNSTLLYNSGLVGHATGNIGGYTPEGWYNAKIIYKSQTTNKFNDVVLSTDGNLMWVSPWGASYTSTGLFTLNSMVDVPNVVNWNASGLFEYGSSLYRLWLHEQSLYGQTEHFLTLVEGGYGGQTVTEAWMSITDSIVVLENVTYANVRAYLSTAIPSNPSNGMLEVKIADYTGNSGVGALYPGDAYPVAGSYFWTQNGLMWYYGDSLTGGSVYTNTSVSAKSAFTLDSRFNLSLAADSANFYLYQTLNGAAGVDSTAHARYDMATGMIADIGGEVLYANKLLFGYNANYDLQLENGVNPDVTALPSLAPTPAPSTVPTSAGPTATPTLAPTLVPTAGPTTVAPSLAPSAAPTTTAPSAAPTLAPTPGPTVPGATNAPTVAPTTAWPTLAPSAAPTAAPTLTPTQAPTLLPTLAPSAGPTLAPTAGPTVPGATNAPTVAPTTAVPTAAPTSGPTVAPSGTTLAPTALPTASPSYALVQFSAAQTLTGINITEYNANFEANQNALEISIAQCIDGATTDNILELQVAAPTSRRLTNLRVEAVSATSDSVAVTYIVSMATGASYDTLSTQLSDNIQNGNFNTYLTAAATTTGGSTALASSTSDSVTTTDLVVTDDNSSGGNGSGGLSVGAIVGIAIAGAVVLFLAIAAYWYFVVGRSGGGGGAGAKPSAVATPVAEGQSSSKSATNPIPTTQNPAYRSRASESSGNSPRNSSLDGRGSKRTASVPAVEPTL